MRIVGGRFKGRALQGPASHDIRPTSDRLRESLFNMLTHRDGGDRITGARVIDLFAGTGALGLEALSRGARFALFVEDGTEARALIRENVHALGVAGISRIFRRDATRLGAAATESFTLAFLDPPYRKGLGEVALGGLAGGGWLAPGALVVLEEAAAATLVVPEGYSLLETRPQGESQLAFLQFG